MKKIIKWIFIFIIGLAILGTFLPDDTSEPKLANENNDVVDESTEAEESLEKDTKDTSDTESNENNSKNKNKPKSYSVGEVIELDNMLVHINDVKTSNGSNEFDAPKEGYKYLILDISINNKTDDFVNISSMLMFNLVNKNGLSYELSLMAPTRGSLDGGIGPGRKIRGEIAFEVPKDKSDFELEIDPEFWSYGISIVKINEKIIKKDASVAFSDDTSDDIKHFEIGDKIKLNDITLKINKIKTSNGGDFETPKKGHEFLIVNSTVENIGEESTSLSSLLQFKVVDINGLSYESVFLSELKGSLDGELAPTRKMTGEIAYEVPKDAKKIELEFIDNFFEDGLIVVDLK